MRDSKQVVLLNLDDILPNRFQPRIKFDEKAIVELSESIKEHGVIQPIIVRKISDKFEIIAGERRYKASVMAGKSTIPAIIVDLNDKDSSEIALIENVQRQNLTPIEEAISYRKILDMGYLTQDALATKLGVVQSTIANKLRLLNLDDEVQEALLDGKISERHARSLLKIDKPSMQRELLKKIIEERLTVRRTDEVINDMLKNNDTSILDSIENNNVNTFEDNIVKELNKNENPFIINNNLVAPQESSNVEVLDFGFEEINPELQARELNQEFEKPDEQINVPTNPIVEDEELDVNTPKEVADITPIQGISNDINLEQLNDEVSEINTDSEINNQNIIDDNVTPVQPKNRFFTMVQPNYEEVVEEEKNNSESTNLDDENIFNQQVDQTSEQVLPENEEVLVNNEEKMPNFNVFNTPVFEQPQAPSVNPIPVEQPSLSTVPTYEPENLNFVNNEPVMPLRPSSPEPVVLSVNLRDVINKMRTCADEIEAMGFDIDTEEYDLDDIYQVIFKIKK